VAGETPFIEELEEKLISQKAIVVFPDGATIGDLRKILTEPWNSVE
jgi:hypothetical protein